MTKLVASYYTNEAHALCERIVILQACRVVADCPPAGVLFGDVGPVPTDSSHQCMMRVA